MIVCTHYKTLHVPITTRPFRPHVYILRGRAIVTLFQLAYNINMICAQHACINYGNSNPLLYSYYY